VVSQQGDSHALLGGFFSHIFHHAGKTDGPYVVIRLYLEYSNLLSDTMVSAPDK
jgi:hypothetical protein